MKPLFLLGIAVFLASEAAADHRVHRRTAYGSRPIVIHSPRVAYRPSVVYRAPRYRSYYRSSGLGFSTPSFGYSQYRSGYSGGYGGYRYPAYRSSYRRTSFGFNLGGGYNGYGYGGYRPSYYRPQPVYYSSPPVYTTSTETVPVAEIQLPAGFEERERRYHKHGSDAGTLDWIKGRLDGRKVKLYFNPDGSIRKRKYD